MPSTSMAACTSGVAAGQPRVGGRGEPEAAVVQRGHAAVPDDGVQRKVDVAPDGHDRVGQLLHVRPVPAPGPPAAAARADLLCFPGAWQTACLNRGE